jgi:regulator of nucleoside diphosphate kinase
MNSRIILSSLDVEKLEILLDSLPESDAIAKTALLGEFSRAEVVEPGDVPASVVTMNSTVRFAMKDSNEEFRMTLAYPKDVAPGSQSISILTPVGSALLGLAAGGRITWPKPSGGTFELEVLEVVYQPEREGMPHCK